jgi:hypothetical protein
MFSCQVLVAIGTTLIAVYAREMNKSDGIGIAVGIAVAIIPEGMHAGRFDAHVCLLWS